MSLSGMPDPLRSHGAWITLCISIAVGALVPERGLVELGLLVGTVFAGGFLVLSALAVGLRRTSRRAWLGLALAGASFVGALALGARPTFLVPLAAAVLCGSLGVELARSRGILDTPTLCVSLAPFTLAAPGVALATGGGIVQSLELFLALWSFACWRSIRVARSLRGAVSWDRTELRARGLREAAWSALWGIAIVAFA